VAIADAKPIVPKVAVSDLPNTTNDKPSPVGHHRAAAPRPVVRAPEPKPVAPKPEKVAAAPKPEKIVPKTSRPKHVSASGDDDDAAAQAERLAKEQLDAALK
jgi:hypothetical protein